MLRANAVLILVAVSCSFVSLHQMYHTSMSKVGEELEVCYEL